MQIGYARTSTTDQQAGLEAQLQELQQAGAEQVYQEQVSAKESDSRPQLQALLKQLRAGDVVVVCKLDRLARSTADLLQLHQKIEDKGATLRVLNLNLDTSTPTGRLLFTMVGSIAQFERELMLERQKEGIAAAKAAGKYKGRKPTARAKADRVLELKEAGKGATEIARELDIGRASVYRILRQHQEQQQSA
ncbi:recombinase family protein [Thiohalobacter thiocyanaticus]|uniref:Recombinase family protein n=1 Tax=Thiohalobacter thiocyanaticus TaxID=585455 RepID=A0A426QJJ2_9GAMM|nr:recombinase family protein [Thiohalobacter thiocyanaticus]RRQ21915.1 recombinase family protein [Thiohalobacter thiocyanaticus]